MLQYCLGRSRVGSEGWNEVEGWRYKSTMGGSRSGIMVRSTCGRVNSTDATKISIWWDNSSRYGYAGSELRHFPRFILQKLSRIPLTFATSWVIKRLCVCTVWRERFKWHLESSQMLVIEIRSMLKLNGKIFCTRYTVADIAYNWKHDSSLTLRKGQVIVE